MSKKTSFWWGVMGAFAPELLRMFKIVSAGQLLPDLQWAIYCGLLLLFACLGGAASIAWKPEAEWKAFWVGASLPTIVASLVQSVPSPGK